METWILLDSDSNYYTVLDKCLANSKKDAEQIFINRSWVIGDVLSEADYIAEHQLNILENQSPEQ